MIRFREWTAQVYTPSSRPLSGDAVLTPLDPKYPGKALRRLIGQVEWMPLPDRGDVSLEVLAVKERFVLLRRLGVESSWSAHQGLKVDHLLLLEIGALTTNRLITLTAAVADRSVDRRRFFELMRSRVESHCETDVTWLERSSGVQALVAAQRKVDFLERCAPLAADRDQIGEVQRCAADCAVYIAFYLETCWGRREQSQAAG